MANFPGRFGLFLGGLLAEVVLSVPHYWQQDRLITRREESEQINVFHLGLVGGIDFSHSSYSTPLIRDAAEAYFGDDYSYRLSASTSIVQGFRMFNDLTNTGTYRTNFDIGASTKIAKWLTWNLSLSDRYLSHPASGRKTNDYLYTTGLGIAFGK